MAIIRTKPGVVKASDGTYPELRGGTSGEAMVADAHGRYLEPARRGNVFFAATPSGQTTTAGLATTYVGLVVSNPVGNPWNLAILKVSYAWTVIASAVNGVGIAVGFNPATNITHSAAITPASTIYGVGPTPTAKADTGAALVTAPVYFMFLGDTPGASTNPATIVVDLEGSLIIPPGGYVCTVTTAVSQTASFWASMMWEEIPV